MSERARGEPDEGGEHRHPRPPDTSKLWVDESWGAVANEVAGHTFVITFISAALFIGAVFVWIFL